MKKLLLSKDKFFIFTLIINLCKYLIIYYKLVDCLEKCLIYGHIRRFAN